MKKEAEGESIRLNIVIPTIGRASLYATLHSIWSNGAGAQDQVIVIGDGRQAEAERIVSFYSERLQIKYLETDRSSDWGASQRNAGIAEASGTHLLFMDDDDVYMDSAISKFRDAAVENPGKIVVFRMRAISRRHPYDVLWKDQTLKHQNISTQMFMIPNEQGKLAIWGPNHGHDFDFIRETVARHPDGEPGIVWREDIIAEIH